MHLLTVEEIEELEGTLSKGALPADFENKLTQLAGGTILHQFVEQHCRLFVALIASIRGSCFPDPHTATQQRLLRVLAYVRKENDLIPDFKPAGFMDDLREVRAALADLQPVIQEFKNWRLRHQVPAMWQS